MNKSFLILHGIENHRPPGHWQHWLAERLREQGHQVLYPGLPDPDTPSLRVWQASLRNHLDQLEGAERVVVCHSLACLLWFSATSMLTPWATPRPADCWFPPPAPDRVPEIGASFRTPFDAPAVRSSVRGEIALACSDRDPYNPAGAQAMYGDPLGVKARVFDGAGHITPDSGYGPWPFIKRLVLSGPPPFSRLAIGSGERLQPRLLDAGELAPEPPVLALLLGSALVALVGEVRALERVGLEVVHLPLVGHLAVGVVVAGELVALLADADDVVRRLRVRAARLPGLPVVVGEDGVVLRRGLGERLRIWSE